MMIIIRKRRRRKKKKGKEETQNLESGGKVNERNTEKETKRGRKNTLNTLCVK